MKRKRPMGDSGQGSYKRTRTYGSMVGAPASVGFSRAYAPVASYRRRFYPRRQYSWRANIPRPMVYNQQEPKYYDKKVTVVAVGDTPTIVPLCTPTQGTAKNERVGDYLYLMQVLIYFQFAIGATDTVDMRLILLLDKQPNGAQFSGSNLMQNASVGVEPYSNFNASYRDRFVILRDKMFTFSNNGNASFSWKLFKRLGVIAHNSGTAQDATDYRTNGLYLYYITNSAVGVAPTISFNSRVHFRDA